MTSRDTDMPNVTVMSRIIGRVQGVGFRAWTRREALRIGLDGWVRNETDGSVTALLSGPEPKVAAMVALLHDGPRTARVTSVKTLPAEAPEQPGFGLLR